MKRLLKWFLISIIVLCLVFVLGIGIYSATQYFNRKDDVSVAHKRITDTSSDNGIMAVDGDFSTSWKAIDNETLTIDLGDIYSLETVVVHTDATSPYRLNVSKDNESYQSLLLDESQSNTYTVDAVEGRYLQFSFDEPGTHHLQELEVFTSQEIGPLRPKEDDIIRIASFNLAAGKLPNLDLLAAEVARENADFMAFQEVDMWMVRNPVNMLKRVVGTSFEHRYFDVALKVIWADYGLGFASNYPASEHDATALPINEGDEPRIYQRLVFEVEGKTIAFYNTHLSFESDEGRIRQLEVIRDAIVNDSTEYKVFLGDLNTGDLNELDLFDGILVNANKDEWLDTFYTEDLGNNVIDHIMVTPNMEIRAFHVGTRQTSDHYLIYTDVVLK